MKTLKNRQTGKLKRVSDKEAHSLVSMGYLGWDYCPKNEWKTFRKNSPSQVEVENTEEISSNLSDKKIRKQRKEQKRQKYESRK